MLQCELCNYFLRAHGKRGGCACEFTGRLFRSPREMEGEEYPCADVSYEQYLQRLLREKSKREVAEAI
jgi:hypothetical protein